MIDSPALIGRWRTGFHPQANELRVRSLGRVYLKLGQALRLEMGDEAPGQEDIVHLQYYIATDLGPWAIWLTCPRRELEACEASLQELTPPFADE
jgi:hypothetical protein